MMPPALGALGVLLALLLPRKLPQHPWVQTPTSGLFPGAEPHHLSRLLPGWPFPFIQPSTLSSITPSSLLQSLLLWGFLAACLLYPEHTFQRSDRLHIHSGFITICSRPRPRTDDVSGEGGWLVDTEHLKGLVQTLMGRYRRGCGSLLRQGGRGSPAGLQLAREEVRSWQARNLNAH